MGATGSSHDGRHTAICCDWTSRSRLDLTSSLSSNGESEETSHSPRVARKAARKCPYLAARPSDQRSCRSADPEECSASSESGRLRLRLRHERPWPPVRSG